MKHYTIEGVTYDKLPDPCKGDSPMTEEHFIELGGVITEDETLTPKEKVIASLNALLQELSGQVQGISIADFKQAAQTLHSGELVGFAHDAGVSEEIINAARIRIVEILADAMREGMTWTELVGGISQ